MLVCYAAKEAARLTNKCKASTQYTFKIIFPGGVTLTTHWVTCNSNPRDIFLYWPLSASHYLSQVLISKVYLIPVCTLG